MSFVLLESNLIKYLYFPFPGSQGQRVLRNPPKAGERLHHPSLRWPCQVPGKFNSFISTGYFILLFRLRCGKTSNEIALLLCG